MKKNLGNSKIMRMRFVCLVVLIAAILLNMVWTTECEIVYAQEAEGEPETEDSEIKILEPYNLNSTGYDVVYVIDNSRSVWDQQAVRNQAFRNISNLAVGADIRIGVVYFADHIYDTLALTSMEDREGSEKVLEFLNMGRKDQDNIDTNIGNALEVAGNMFDSQDSSRERIVVLFSDGINENLAGDSEYKEAADRKTEVQTARLESMNAKIYCVYLQKERNDEKYLHRLVNYFSDKKNYVPERFSKVTEQEIDTLSDKFAAVYFAMQNNMKYRKVMPDSSGNVNFYIPSLGVEKLQVYLDGRIQECGLAAVDEDQYTTWEDGEAAFIEYEEPEEGDCTIEIKGSDVEDISGTIACYAYLQVAVEIRKEEEGKGDKNKEYQMIVRFYDRRGKEVQIDPKANVDAKVFLLNEEEDDDEDEPREIAPVMRIKEGIAESKPFVLDEYGTYSYAVHLTYEDFIDLRYSSEGVAIEKTAPVVHDMKDGKFDGEKTENGKIAFSIKESKLYEDWEGEEITIEEVVQLNEANQVSVIQSDGYINVTADDTGGVDFALRIMDASGMGAEVTVQGELSDKGIARILKRVIVVVVLIAALIILLIIFDKKRKEMNLKENFSEFDRIDEEFGQMSHTVDEEEDKFREKKIHFESILETIAEYNELLEEEQTVDFGLDVYQKEDYKENLILEGEEIEKVIASAKKGIDLYRMKAKSVKNNQGNVGKANQEIKECCEKALGEFKKLEDGYEKLKQHNENLSRQIKGMQAADKTVREMLKTNIECELLIRDITALPNVPGRKGFRNDAGRFLRGFYKLDDVKLLSKGGFGDIVGKTGIYVYGYEDETGSIGLELRSIRGFYCDLSGAHTEQELRKEMKLKKGNLYRLKVQVDGREIGMILEIK